MKKSLPNAFIALLVFFLSLTIFLCQRRRGPVLVALDPPSPGVSVYEPHIAIDPVNPDRIAVAAQYGIRGGRAGRNLQLWVSEDAGRTWFSRRVPRPKFHGEFTADPLVAFDTDGNLLIVGDCVAKEMADVNDSLSFDRLSVPTLDHMWSRWEQINPDTLTSAAIGVSRSEDGGRTLTATAMPGVSPGADKPSIAVDRSVTSSHRGSVYVSWFDRTPSLRVATSSDGAWTFAPPAVLNTWATAFMQQLAVRPDGSVHLVWTLGSAPGLADQFLLPPEAPSEAATSIYHAVSTDGGATFSEPAIVATNAGPGMVGVPSLAVDGNGRLLWVWGQAESLPDPAARPVIQSRHRLYGIRCDDGVSWSAPYELCPGLPATTHMGLPALTSDSETWWILTYLADDEETRVVLLRSDDGGGSFHLDRTLATRAIPVDEISLMGSYLLRFCDKDTSQVGEYVGVAAAGSRVVAAFILPETDQPTSKATAYVAIVDTR